MMIDYVIRHLVTQQVPMTLTNGITGYLVRADKYVVFQTDPHVHVSLWQHPTLEPGLQPQPTEIVLDEEEGEGEGEREGEREREGEGEGEGEREREGEEEEEEEGDTYDFTPHEFALCGITNANTQHQIQEAKRMEYRWSTWLTWDQKKQWIETEIANKNGHVLSMLAFISTHLPWQDNEKEESEVYNAIAYNQDKHQFEFRTRAFHWTKLNSMYVRRPLQLHSTIVGMYGRLKSTLAKTKQQTIPVFKLKKTTVVKNGVGQHASTVKLPVLVSLWNEIMPLRPMHLITKEYVQMQPEEGEEEGDRFNRREVCRLLELAMRVTPDRWIPPDVALWSGKK